MVPTTMEAPATGGTDVFDDIGAALNEGLDQSSADEQPQSDAAAEPVPGTEAAADATGQPEQPATGDAQYQLTEDGNHFLVPKTELSNLSAVRQYSEAVQNFFPTPNDAQTAYNEASDFRALQSDYAYNGEQGIDGVLKYLSGHPDVMNGDPAYRAKFQESFVKLAEKMPEALKGVNEQAYNNLVGSFVQKEIDNLYAWAAQEPDPQRKAEALQRAQYADWAVTGKYSADGKPQAAQAQQAQPDPREQSLTQRENAMFDRDWKTFDGGTVNGPKWTEFNTYVDQTLANVKANYDPAVFDAIRDRVVKQTIDKLKEDSAWVRKHDNAFTEIKGLYQQSWKGQQQPNGVKPYVQAYNADFMARVRRVLPSVAKPLVEKAPVRGAKRAATPAPQQRAAAPASNGSQQQNGKRYDILEDPEYKQLFRVPAR